MGFPFFTTGKREVGIIVMRLLTVVFEGVILCSLIMQTSSRTILDTWGLTITSG